ncbi:MAG: hypothetical protein QW104_04255 [Nitrososphaerota archaeon]
MENGYRVWEAHKTLDLSLGYTQRIVESCLREGERKGRLSYIPTACILILDGMYGLLGAGMLRAFSTLRVCMEGIRR